MKIQRPMKHLENVLFTISTISACIFIGVLAYNLWVSEMDTSDKILLSSAFGIVAPAFAYKILDEQN